MEIVNQKREMDMYTNHVNRIKAMTAFIDTSTPSSLGLKHLAARPKKQQLIDDRRQEIAKENKKLMENMAKILSENKMNSNLNSSSNLRHTINETQRKNAVEKLNFENRLLYSRLQNIAPMIKRKEFQKDYEKNKSFHSRRRRHVPFGFTNNTIASTSLSPLNNGQSQTSLTSTSYINNNNAQSSSNQHNHDKNNDDDNDDPESDSFLAQYRNMNNIRNSNSQYGNSLSITNNDQQISPGLPQSISEFRRQVISSKRIHPNNHNNNNNNNSSNSVIKLSQHSHNNTTPSAIYQENNNRSSNQSQHEKLAATKYILSYDPSSSI